MPLVTLDALARFVLGPFDPLAQDARRQQGAQPPTIAAEIARSLRTRGDHWRAHAAAISTLRLSGTGELVGEIGVARDTLFGVARGVSFAGAAERLQRIVERSHYVDARQAALRSLSMLNRTPEFLGYLRQLAVAPTGIAAMAVEILVDSRGLEGRAIARELYKSNAIRNYEALWILQGKAAALGW